jgi:hypothetical protein
MKFLLPYMVVFISCSVTWAQLMYDPPAGGWDYYYDPQVNDVIDNAPDAALDGNWTHTNGSDEWDGTEIGDGAPGGISLITEGDTTFIRIQDTGDPRDYEFTDPSNRKIYLGHLITADLTGGEEQELLFDGVTLIFRMRIPTTGLIDEIHPPGGSGPDPYPAGGDGYLNNYGGKGNVTISQSTPYQAISFNLHTLDSDIDDDATALLDADGLNINKTNGTEAIGDVSYEGADYSSVNGSANILALNPIQWHEYWITILPAESGDGTHEVKIYLDGNLQAETFIVTAGTGSEFSGQATLAIGCGSTTQHGAMDLDFVGYKYGAFAPTGATGILLQASEIPINYQLSQNYPNPFNPSTMINYQLPKANEVELSIFNVLGQKVVTLVSERQPAGSYRVQWNGRDKLGNTLVSGIYIYKLQAGSFIQTRKMTLIK